MSRVSFTPKLLPKIPENKKIPSEVNTIWERPDYFRVSITGSQGDEYTIFVVRDMFLCSCPAGAYRENDNCRHIKILKEYLGV